MSSTGVNTFTTITGVIMHNRQDLKIAVCDYAQSPGSKNVTVRKFFIHHRSSNIVSKDGKQSDNKQRGTMYSR